MFRDSWANYVPASVHATWQVLWNHGANLKSALRFIPGSPRSSWNSSCVVVRQLLGNGEVPTVTALNIAVVLVVVNRSQELCESRGGRPGLPSLINLRFLWT